MNYAAWQGDAREVARLIPDTAPVHERAAYLANDVAPRGQVFPVCSIDELPQKDSPGFAVVAMNDLDLATASPGIQKLILGDVAAFVTHTPNATVMGLRWPNPKTRISNGMLLLHELEHVTEDEGFTTVLPEGADAEEIAGIRERRAYSINVDALRAVDGDEFDEYVSRLAYRVSGANLVRGWATRLVEHPKPPKDTLMRELHAQGRLGRLLLASTAMAASLDTLAETTDTTRLHKLFGRIQSI